MKISRKPKTFYLRGGKIGRLTVLYPTKKRSKDGCIIWRCQCDCGKLSDVVSYSLSGKRTLSCGCLAKEKARISAKTLGENNIKHGASKGGILTRLYQIWRSMKERCYNQKTRAYKTYGNRGIIVCKEWKNNYQAFRFWAILNGYQDNLTIDRIDNDGNYEPSNCQFLTKSENSKKRFRDKKHYDSSG